MIQFFSYPYNYKELSNYVKDTADSAIEKAAKVSDNNHDSFAKIEGDDSETILSGRN